MNKYLEPIESFLENNDWSLEELDFICLQYDVVEKMEMDNVSFEITKDVLKLMEKNPLVEFGTPGSLTHFIEKFYNENQEEYEKIILESLKQTPSVHAIWLLNRLINGNEETRAIELLEVMKSIHSDDTLHKDIRNTAEFFIENH